jgi:acyl-CoA thioester hydrolase
VPRLRQPTEGAHPNPTQGAHPDDEAPFSVVLDVRWSDLDANGHVANSRYLDFATQVRFEFFSQRDLGPQRMRALGVGPVVLSDTIRYRREVTMGEPVTVDLALTGLRRDCGRWQFVQSIWLSDGKLAAVASADGGWLSLEARRLIKPPQVIAEVMLEMPRAKDFQWMEQD